MSNVVVYNEDTIWLTQMQMLELVDTTTDNINLDLKNIYKEKEFDKNSTIDGSSIVRKEGNKSVKRNINKMNIPVNSILDV